LNNSMLTLKYRPFSFKDVIGSKGTILDLKGRSNTLNYPQVMLFEGMSGTGKTTSALIVAGLINCKNLIKDEQNGIKFLSPCGECISCKDIIKEQFRRSVYKFDASKMGKEDIFQIQNLMDTASMMDKNKIIIIDEAQELSKAGKGAILNLLEKTRKNVYIILCTMNIEKFDIAVKSRAQSFKFKLSVETDIAQLLFNIVDTEKSEVPDDFVSDGLFTIAKIAEGNIRLAIQFLDRCLVGKFYTNNEILENIESISTDNIIRLLSLLLKKDNNFFKEIAIFDITNFYYYSWTTLVNSYIFKVTGYVDQEWKKPGAQQLAQYDLKKLILIYNDVSRNRSYSKNVFLSNIVEYFENGNNKLIRSIKK